MEEPFALSYERILLTRLTLAQRGRIVGPVGLAWCEEIDRLTVLLEHSMFCAALSIEGQCDKPKIDPVDLTMALGKVRVHAIRWIVTGHHFYVHKLDQSGYGDGATKYLADARLRIL